MHYLEVLFITCWELHPLLSVLLSHVWHSQKMAQNRCWLNNLTPTSPERKRVVTVFFAFHGENPASSSCPIFIHLYTSWLQWVNLLTPSPAFSPSRAAHSQCLTGCLRYLCASEVQPFLLYSYLIVRWLKCAFLSWLCVSCTPARHPAVCLINMSSCFSTFGFFAWFDCLTVANCTPV